MQQNCVDDIVNRNYTELNDTLATVNETRRIVAVEVSPYICQPFDCNGHGRCVNGKCVCDPSMYYRAFTLFLAVRQMFSYYHSRMQRCNAFCHICMCTSVSVCNTLNFDRLDLHCRNFIFGMQAYITVCTVVQNCCNGDSLCQWNTSMFRPS